MAALYSWEFAGRGRGVGGGSAGAGDTTAPTLVSAIVSNSTPGRIDLTWSEAMNATVSASSAFAVSAGHTLTAHTYVDATHSYLTTSTDFTNGEAARTLAYTQPGSNKMQDAAGNLLANFSGTAITNNVGSSAITSSVLASRTSGTAPLYIHFDASGTTSSDTSITSAANGGAFRNIINAFDFGDTGAGNWTQTGLSRNGHTGAPITAHVFETPGTYTVNVTHSHSGTGDKAATPITITVRDPNVNNSASGGTNFTGTNTVCVNNAGTNDGLGPAGCAYVSSASLTSLTNGRRYLFKRGQTHDLPSGSWDTVYAGAYGSGADPIISANGIQNLGTTGGNVIMDCEVHGLLQYARGRNNLAMRCTVKNPVGSVTVATQEDGFTLSGYTCYWELTIDCGTTHDGNGDPGGAGIYGFCSWVAFMGCSIVNEGQHALRWPNAYKSCIQHCYIPGNGSNGTKHAIKVHANLSGATPTLWDESTAGTAFATEKIVISNNRLGATDSPKAWTCATDPQNDSGTQPEGIQDVVIENNIFTRGTSGSPTDSVQGGRRITARGNTSSNATVLISTSVNPSNIPSGWDGPYFAS